MATAAAESAASFIWVDGAARSGDPAAPVGMTTKKQKRALGVGAVLPSVATALVVVCGLARLFLRVRHFGGLKDSPRQLLEILPGLRSSVIFVFQLSPLSSSLKAGHAHVGSALVQMAERVAAI